MEKPALDTDLTRHFLGQVEPFSIRGINASDFELFLLPATASLLNLLEFQAFNAFEAFLDVFIDTTGVLGIAQKFEQVVILNEVEAGELFSLSFQQLEKDLLGFVQLTAHIVEIL
jgi:hypothetical protein